MPKVTIGIFIIKPTPFLEEFFDSILALEYPREKLGIFIYNAVSEEYYFFRKYQNNHASITILPQFEQFQVQHHSEVVDVFVDTYGSTYTNIKLIKHTESYSESIARNLAV